MLGKALVQGISGILLLSAALMFVIGAQAGALKPRSTSIAPIIASADPVQSAPLDLF